MTDQATPDQANPDVEHEVLDGLEGTGRLFEDDREPAVVRLRLAAGESVAPHTHPGKNVVFFVVDGQFDVTVADETYRVETGDCLRFDGDNEVAPHATDEAPATALIVLAKK